MYKNIQNFNILNSAYYWFTYLKQCNNQNDKLIETLLVSGLWELANHLSDKKYNNIKELVNCHPQFESYPKGLIDDLISDKVKNIRLEEVIESANPILANRLLYLCIRYKKLRYHIPKLEKKIRVPFYLPLLIRKNGFFKRLMTNYFSSSFIKTCELYDPLPFQDSKKGKKLKVAVCISGQMRNYKNAKERLNKALASFDVTYFIHTWENTGGKNAGAMDVHQLARMTNRSIANKMISYNSEKIELPIKFPLFFEELTRQIASKPKITYSDLNVDYPNSICVIENDENFEAPNIEIPVNINTYKMLYKIHACDQLRKDYEEENQVEFDAVIRIRPDLIVSDYIDLHSIIAGDSVATGFLINRFIDDQIYISKPETMTRLTKLWKDLKNYEAASVSDSFILTNSPHNLIWSHFYKENINYTIIPVNCWLATETPDIEKLEIALQEDMDNG